jgi:hypothetical protein
MSTKYLTEAFDLNAVYDEKIMPLMELVYDLCKEHNIPFTAHFCTKNVPNADGGNVDFRGGTYLNGPERTPYELMLASEAVEGIEALQKTIRGIAMASLIDRISGGAAKAQQEEPAPAPAEG